MLYSVYVLVLVSAYLASIVFSHAAWNRLAHSTGAPQGRTLLVVAGNFLFFAATSSLLLIQYGGSLAWIPYLVICLAAAGYCYWSLICLSESGRRYRIVFLVDSGEALHIEDLVKLYGREAIIQERLRRLEQWGEVTRTGDRVLCTRGRLYKASLVVYTWSRLLGFRWF